MKAFVVAAILLASVCLAHSTCFDSVTCLDKCYYIRHEAFIRAGCCLKNVPDDIPIQAKLIRLEHNDIADIASGAFECLSASTHLNVSHNKLTIIKRGYFRGLMSLLFLNMNENQIFHIENGAWEGVVGLRHIELTGNKLMSLMPNYFKNLSSIEVLHLTKNRIFVIWELSRTEQLIGLSLPENNIAKYQGTTYWDLLSCTNLSLANNKFKSVRRGMFHGLSSLINLFLRKNRISQIEYQGWTGLNTLEYLDLSLNKLTKLKVRGFVALVSLHQLDLRDNCISVIQSGAFCGLNELKSLQLSDNKLFTLHSNTFDGLQHLEELSILENPITKLNPETLRHLPRPIALGLSWSREPSFWWECDTLCWLKSEEQAGYVTWLRKGSVIMKPSCNSSVQWEEVMCELSFGLPLYQSMWYSQQRKTVFPIFCQLHQLLHNCLFTCHLRQCNQTTTCPATRVSWANYCSQPSLSPCVPHKHQHRYFTTTK